MIFTSHYIDEVERLSDRVIVIKKGTVAAEGTVEQLVGEYCRSYVYILQFYSLNKSFCEELKKKMPVKKIDEEDNKVKIYVEFDVNTLECIVRTAAELNLAIKNIDIKKPGLEDVFFYFSEEGTRT